jgi:hypothetical protein
MKTRIIQNGHDEPATNGTGNGGEGSGKPPRATTNLAGRMGRWSARHRKIAIFGWFGFVIVAFALGTVSGTTEIDPNTSGVGESGRVDRILDAGFTRPAEESVLVQSDTLRVKDPAFVAAIDDVVARCRRWARSRTSSRPSIRTCRSWAHLRRRRLEQPRQRSAPVGSLAHVVSSPHASTARPRSPSRARSFRRASCRVL